MMSKTCLVLLFVAQLCVSCKGDGGERNATPTGTPTKAPESAKPAPKDELVVSPVMQAFVKDFHGAPASLVAALKKYGPSHPELVDKEKDTYAGTIAFMRDLKNARVTGKKAEGKRECYVVSAEEFPDDPDEHTLRRFKVCIEGGEVVSLGTMVHGGSL